MAPYFRKKPIIVEARQNDGTEAVARALMNWIDPDNLNAEAAAVALQEDDGTWAVHVQTLEGTMKGAKGWWIIKGVEGEFYPCDPAIFEKTYEDA